MKPFTDTPNEARLVTDNTEAKLFLTQHGLLDKLLEFGKRPPNTSGPWSSRIYSDDHPTHWIVADYFTGFPNAADNGFAVKGVPKSRCSWEQFRRIEQMEAKERFPHGVESDESGPLEPPSN